MNGLAPTIGIVTGLLTILGTVVAVTLHVARLQSRIAHDRLKHEKQDLETRLADLGARYDSLVAETAASRSLGGVLLARKMEVDAELTGLMHKLRATAGSVYVPVRAANGELQGLAFLSIEPFGKESQALRRRLVPVKSLAGRCFATGEPFVAGAQRSPDHFQAADRISAYRTRDTLNLALRLHGEVVGVVQLLNREGGEPFTETDLIHAQALLGPLPERVAEFARQPAHLEFLGLSAETEAETATVMFCDLTRSSLLFQEMSPSIALKLLNEYFEAICTVAFDHGGTVDNYLGDGVMIRFNVPKPVPDHRLAAVRAALAMATAFKPLKAYWMAMSPKLDVLHTRCGIASGPVLRATLGHPNHQHLTLLGYPVAVAAHLCSQAPRDGDAVVIDDATHAAIAGRVAASPLPALDVRKVAAFVSGAYLVTAIAV